jgi:hypothetical protein
VKAIEQPAAVGLARSGVAGVPVQRMAAERRLLAAVGARGDADGGEAARCLRRAFLAAPPIREILDAGA